MIDPKDIAWARHCAGSPFSECAICGHVIFPGAPLKGCPNCNGVPFVSAPIHPCPCCGSKAIAFIKGGYWLCLDCDTIYTFPPLDF
jgi:hypothetical protein